MPKGRASNGRAHFRTTLEKTVIRMTTDEITSLVDALKSNGR